MTGASVVVTNVGTGTSAALKTNETGYYEATLLLPGDYRVTAEATGFKRAVRSGLTVLAGARIEVDFRLDVGNVAETVSVTAQAPLLDTSTASSGWVLDNRSVMELPLLQNNVLLPVKLTPGLQGPGVNYYSGLHANGLSSRYTTASGVGGNEWTVDGAPNNGIGQDVAHVAHADTVQEIKVETSAFDASLGHTTGVSVAVMTKAGTNQFHGTVTEQHWQNRWHGAPFFTKQNYYRAIAQAESAGDTARAAELRSKPKLPAGNSNNYSATIGGPVMLPGVYNGKDKLFFFFAFNGSKETSNEAGSAVNNTIPTVANRQGDFSQLLNVDAVRYRIYDPLTVRQDPARPGHYIRDPFANNVLPSSRIVNPAYSAYVKLLPTPNNDPTDPRKEPLNNYLAVAMPQVFDYKGLTNRVDYQHSMRHRFYGRWNWSHFLEDRQDWTYESARGLHTDGNFRDNLAVSADWIFTPLPATVLNVTVAGNQYSTGMLYQGTRKYKPSDVGLPAYLDAKAAERQQLPVMSVSGYQPFGYSGYFVTRTSAVSTKADVTHITGNHTIRFGIDARDHFRSGEINSDTSGSFSFGNAYTRRNDDTFTPAGDLGHSWAAFMMGLPASMTLGSNDNYIMSNPYFGWYAQDNWRISRKLSVTFGLRAEYEFGLNERYNRMIGWFDPKATLPIGAAAQAAYAQSAVPELPASSFVVRGGSVYPGVDGSRERTTQNELMWMPRLAAAWQINSKTVLRGGFGLFYDTNNVMRVAGWRAGPDQTGFSRSTSTTLTTDFGATWLAGDPARGISPLADPFPVRADGTRFNEPVRDKLGLMARVGRGWTFSPFDYQRARQQRWRIGIQRQIGADMLIDVAYAGSYSDRLAVSRRLDALPAQYWADGLVRNDALASNLNANVPNPFQLKNFAGLQTTAPLIYQDMSTLAFYTSSTIRKNQLLRPFPHMNSVTNSAMPIGEARSDALEVYFQKRFSRGFNLNLTYTRMAASAGVFEDEFDLSPTAWRETNNTRPHRLTGTGVWKLPFGKGQAMAMSGWSSVLLGGWQIALTYEWQPGPLLSFGNLFYYGNLEDIAKGPGTLDRWFNTEGFERNSSKGPASFHKRVFPSSVPNARSDMTNQWNGNVQREFKLKERLALQMRCDVLNLQNRSQFAAPSTSPFSTDFGRVTSQTNATMRFVQVQARIRF